MSFFSNILMSLPEVAGPKQKNLGFKEKLKWTLLILVLFYLLGLIRLFGGSDAFGQQFEYLQMILGAEFGSLISLGIGPIVTASIVLQLLNGSGLIKFDLRSPEGKKNFEGLQKLLSIFFIIFESSIYVFMGGIAAADPGAGALFTKFQLQLLLVFQLFIGGILIMLMDEVVSKWGFGSGISLFIAAGVSKQMFIKAFSWVKGIAGMPSDYSIGRVWMFFQALAAGDLTYASLALGAILSTVVVFVVAVYTQAMKVEIPLSFGRIRGHGVRWPLSFIYTSNIPVILVAALFANIQLWSRLMQAKVTDASSKVLFFISKYIVGRIDGPDSGHGIVQWIMPPGGHDWGFLGEIIKNKTLFIGWDSYLHAFGYVLFMIAGAIVFSYFWVQTAGMDARSQAKQIMASGLQIPGFRRDQRVLERLLERYIGPLTIMGAIAVGFLAAIADLTGALGRGTGILLTVMIIYKLYEEIAQQHMMDMHPMLRKMME